MRKLLVALMLFAGAAHAGPIVSDWYVAPAVKPTTCRIALDGSTTFTAWPVEVNPDTSVRCRIDISAVAIGAHTSVIKACVDATECSATTPFAFTIVGITLVPAATTGLRILP